MVHFAVIRFDGASGACQCGLEYYIGELVLVALSATLVSSYIVCVLVGDYIGEFLFPVGACVRFHLEYYIGSSYWCLCVIPEYYIGSSYWCLCVIPEYYIQVLVRELL